MPEAFAAWLAEEIGVTLFTAEVITTAAIVVTTTAVSLSQQRAAQRAAKNAYNASLTDHQVMIRSAIVPRTITYGRDKLSGQLPFGLSTGDKGEYLHLIVVLAAHECDAIEKVYFNEIELPDPDSDGFIQTGQFSKGTVNSAVVNFTGTSTTLPHFPSQITSVTLAGGVDESSIVDPTAYTLVGSTLTFTASGTYTINYEWQQGSPLVRIKKHLGQPGQVADPDLIAESGGKWTSAHVGNGICYLYVRLQYDQDVFGQIGVPTIAGLVRAKKLRDPRTGLVAWSDNAALCAADYMLDADLGMGFDADTLPDDELITAANIADETVVLDHDGTTQARYTTNGTLGTDTGRRDNLSSLLAPMAGTAVWVQGRWLLRAGAYLTPDWTLDESWLAQGTLQTMPRPKRTDVFNAVTGTYLDPTQGYAEVQIPPVTNPTYQAEDGGKQISIDVQMPLVNDSLRAQRLNKITLERARQALTLTVTCNLRAYDSLPTQVGAVSLSRYGFAGKPFEVRQRKYDPDARIVTLTLQETASEIWDWNYGEATTVDLAPNTTLPDPFAPPPQLGGVDVETGTAQLLRMSDGTIVTRGLVTWDESADIYVQSGGTIEVQWKLDTDTNWQSAPPIPGDSTSTYIGPLDDRRITLVRVRAVTSTVKAGPYTTVSILVVGKDEPPSNVTGFAASVVQGGVALTWDPCPDPDYLTTVLTVVGGDTLFQGAANAYTWPWPVLGTYTVTAVHFDTSLNESATPASVTFTVDAAIQEQWDNLAGRPLSYRVIAKGFSDTSAPATVGFYNDANTRVYGGNTSYSVAVISRSTGLVVRYDYYNVLSFGQTAPGAVTPGTTITAMLNGVATTEIVVVWTFDEPMTNRLQPTLLAAMLRNGASQGIYGSPEFQYRGAYVLVGIGGCGEGNGFESYQGDVPSDTSAWCDASFQILQGRLIVSGTTAKPRTLRDYSYEGTLDATTDVLLIARGQCVLNGNTASKPTGAAAWDSDVYSIDGFTGAAFAQASPAQNNRACMFGLNTDPVTDQTYSSLNYAWYMTNGGTLDIFESNVSRGYTIAYAANDILLITYDGSAVRYMQNGVVRRTVAAAAGQTMYWDSSFNAIGATLNNIKIGPLSDISGVIAQAQAALDAADAAQADADTANAALANIASDNVLSQGEKPTVILDVSNLTNEKSGIDASATAYGVTTEKTNYDNAYAALNTYLATLTTPVLWNNLTGNTTIVGTTFRTNFANVYSTRQTLLNKIAAIAKSLADAAQTAANNAQAAADAAQADADTANAALANIASDNVLTPVEKSTVILDYTNLTNEKAGIDAQAIALSVSTEKTNYDNAYAALTTYLGTLTSPVAWNNTSGNTTIVGTTFRTNFANVYSTRQVLLDKLAAIATQDVTLVGRGISVVGNTAKKTGGTNALWDSDVYSTDMYYGGAYASASPDANTSAIMFGLNSNPTADSSYTSIDYAMYCQTDGHLSCYESGVNHTFSGPPTYAANDTLAVIYDGAYIKYLHNGAILRTVTVAAGLAFSFDSSFYTSNGILNAIRFGPMSAVNNIATVQISDTAATEYYVLFDAAGIGYSNVG